MCFVPLHNKLKELENTLKKVFKTYLNRVFAFQTLRTVFKDVLFIPDL